MKRGGTSKQGENVGAKFWLRVESGRTLRVAVSEDKID